MDEPPKPRAFEHSMSRALRSLAHRRSLALDEWRVLATAKEKQSLDALPKESERVEDEASLEGALQRALLDTPKTRLGLQDDVSRVYDERMYLNDALVIAEQWLAQEDAARVASAEFFDALLPFANENMEKRDASTAAMLGVFEEISQYRDVLIKQASRCLVQPIRQFSEAEMRERVDAAEKAYKEARDDYDDALQRNVDRKDRTEGFFALNVNDARINVTKSAMHLSFEMAHIDARRSFALQERVAVFLSALKTYHRNASRVIGDLEEKLHAIGEVSEQKEARWKAYREAVDKRIERVGNTVSESAQSPRHFETTETTICGYVFRQGTGIRKNWKKKFAELGEDGLLTLSDCGDKDKDKEAKTFNSWKFSVRELSESEWPCCFEIVSPELPRPLVLMAESERWRDEWLAVLRNAQRKHMERIADEHDVPK